MDSKLKRKVVAVAIVMILLVVATVFGANYIKDKDTGHRHNADRNDQVYDGIPQTDSNKENVGQYGQLDPTKDPSAFLKDESFFDPVIKEQDPTDVLSLLISSVEKDLRVTVVDGYGNPVYGQKFSIQVKDKKGRVHNYQDPDQDGYIYIAPVESGNYTLSLKGADDFILADASDVPAIVKEQIDYTIVDDISVLIKSEDEIDEKAEDTAINEAEMDSDGTESNEKLSDDEALFGIDVSKWNKEIDWQAVANAGVDFAIIRCGYRGSKTGALVEDPYFEKNIQGAEEAGIKVGIYFFTQAVSPVEAVEEASIAVALSKKYKLALPIFIDTEGAGGNGRADGLNRDVRTAVCETFCRTVENAGFNAGVYASKHWLEHNLSTDRLKDFTIWLAQYSKNATYEGEYALWQYTSAGTIDGITTRVDLNLCYKKY